VPWLFGWKDPFIDSVAFTVILHMGTLLALLVYFWRDWLKLIPAGLAAIRDRSFKGDPDRKMAFLLSSRRFRPFWSDPSSSRSSRIWCASRPGSP
jgi:undecaprenyl pyrophosphate phosphatase UppP